MTFSSAVRSRPSQPTRTSPAHGTSIHRRPWVSLWALLTLGLFATSRMLAQPGLIDPSFVVPELRTVVALATMPDGRVIFTGSFTNASGSVLAAARLAPDGTLEWRSDAIPTTPTVIVGSASGEILVGGDNRAYRYLPPASSADPAFTAGNGWRTTDPWVVALQPDNGVLIGGTGATAATMDWQSERSLRALPLRVQPSGVRDVDFGNRVGTGTCFDVAVHADGSFLAVRSAIQRFFADGTPDASFTAWPAAQVELLRLLPSGNYLIGGGSLSSFNGSPCKNLAIVDPTGHVLPSFNYAGTFDVTYDATGPQRPVTVLADGRVVAAQPNGGVKRFLATGEIDPAWTDPAPSVTVRKLVSDARGQVFLVGFLEGASTSKPLYRLVHDDSGPVDAPPKFITQPSQATTVTPGASLTLTVAVTGRPEPVLQWWFNGAPLAEQNQPTLSLSNLESGLVGTYFLQASNRLGVARSTLAQVYLDPGAARPGTPDAGFTTPPLNPPSGAPGFIPTVVNPVFWGGAATTNHGVILWGNFVARLPDLTQHLGVIRLLDDGAFDSDFRPNGQIRDAGAGVLLPDGRLILGAVFESGATLRNGLIQLNPDGSPDASFHADDLFDGTVQAAVRLLVRQPDDTLLAGGTFAKVAGEARPGLVRFLPNGTLDRTFATLPLSSRVAHLALTSDGHIYVAGSFSLPGAITEVSLIRLHPDGTLDSSFTPLKTISGLVGLETLPDDGVVGLTAGVAQTTPVPLNSLFRLRADGTPDTSFDAGLPNRIGSALRRRPDGSFLVAGDPASAPGAPSIARHLAGGALDPFYTNAPVVSNVRSLLNGTLGRAWVIAAQHPGALRLQADDYTPPVPPLILKQPASLHGAGLVSATFHVVADGVRPLTYQWRFNGDPIAGATSDLLNVAPVTPDKLGTYDVVVTGGGFSTTSAGAVLSNLIPPTITTPPIVRTNVVEGASVTLFVEASGSLPLAYQWRFNGVDLPNQTNPTLVLTDLRLDQQGLYSVVVSNAAASVESSPTDLKVDPRPVAPVIIREPEDVTLIAGISSACLEVGFAGTPPLFSQWQRNGADLPGATGPRLCLGPLNESEGGLYRLVITNALGRAESREARVAVVPPIFAITRPPSTVNLIPGRLATFSADVRNDAGRPLTYQWKRNGVNLPNATNATLRLDPPTPDDAQANFSVLVSDGLSTLTSLEALATARPEVSFCPAPAASIYRTRSAILPIHLTVSARGFGSLSYQWRQGPAQIGTVAPLSAFVAIPGAISDTLTLPSLSDADTGDYFCEVRNDYGSSVVEGLAQTSAIRIRLVDQDQRPGRVDFAWDYLTLGNIWALNGVHFLPDGRLLVAGAFGDPFLGCSPLRLLARLHSDGNLDPTFAPVTASFGTAVGLVRQPTGKLVIAGDFRDVPSLANPAPGISPGWARFDANGSLDPTFSTPETAFNGSGGIQIAGQLDGRILFVRSGRVHRLLVDGAHDSTFGGTIPGSSLPGIQPPEGIRRMIVDPQDRIYLLGETAVRRYTPQGLPDPAWTVNPVPENLVRMDVGPLGEVIATGYAAGVEGAPRVVRFLPNGALDAQFHADYPVGGTVAGAPGIQPDGRILLAGTVGTLSARLNADGSRDETWTAMASPGGVTSPAFEPYWFFAADGRAVIAGFAFDDGIHFATVDERQLMRLQNGGSAAGQLRLETPRFLDGQIVFSLPTEPGRTYQVQFVGALGGGDGGVTQGWEARQTIAGDGTAKTVTLGTTGTLGFYRVVILP